jgi:hypothetical protein
MSFSTLLHICAISKEKNFPLPFRKDFGSSCPSPMMSRQKEACHAL